ncbi:MAG: ABC transporter ATP-binding protein [Cytophagaceae bacterium]
MKELILETIKINKWFEDPAKIHVLKDINLMIYKGEYVSIIGRSGSGKSTLLYILSTMDTSYDGELWLDKELMSTKNHHELSIVRNKKIGFIFQFHYLLPEFTVLDNVMLPGMKLGQLDKNALKDKAMHHLDTLGVANLANRKASQVSGGEKQRISIARALINDPIILMCDEPTGNLDKKNADKVFDIFTRLAKENNQTILVVTHDNEFASKTDRIIEMDDGRVI